MWDVQRITPWRTHFSADEWRSLTAALVRLPASVSVELLPQIGFGFLPGSPSPDAAGPFSRLCELVRDGKPTNRALKRSADVAGPAPTTKRRRAATQREAVLQAARTHTEEEAVEAVRNARYAGRTATTYASSAQAWILWHDERGSEPFPVCMRALEAFAGFMLLAKTRYKQPGVILSAIKAAQERHHGPWQEIDPFNRVAQIAKALERGLTEADQAVPATVDDLVALVRTASTAIELAAALIFCAAFFYLLRVDSALHISPEHVKFRSGTPDEVTLAVSALKGATRDVLRPVTLERLDASKRLVTATPSLLASVRELRLCPASVMAAVRDMDAAALLGKNTVKEPYTRARRTLFGEDGKSGLAAKAKTTPGLSWHSARAGGTCALLKAGLRQDVVQDRGFWESDSMVLHYSRTLSLNPSAVQAFAFCCPKALAESYSAFR